LIFFVLKRIARAFLESLFPLSVAIIFIFKEKIKMISAAIGAIRKSILTLENYRRHGKKNRINVKPKTFDPKP
jgi:hypothetical protein